MHRHMKFEHSGTKGRGFGTLTRVCRTAPLFFVTPVVLMLSLGGCGPSMQKDFSRLDDSIGSLRAIQAEHTSELESIQAEIRRLSGKLEEIEYSQSQRIGQDIRVLRDDLSTLRQRVPPPPIVPSDALEADEAYARGIG